MPVRRLKALPGRETGAAAGTFAGRRHQPLPARPLGLAEADRALGGGFPAAGLAEIHLDETRGSGSGTGFALALACLFAAGPSRPVLWAGEAMAFREGGMPYLPGFAAFGLVPGALVVVKAKRLPDAVWAGEEAAASGALSLAILEVRGNPSRLALEGTRRLHLRAREAGIPILLLRQNARAEATAAPLRLRVGPGPAAAVPGLAGCSRLLGYPAFDVSIEKSPNGPPQRLFLEWNPDERRFASAVPPAAEPLPGPLAAEAFHRSGAARATGAVVAFERRLRANPAQPRTSLESGSAASGRR